MTPSLLTAKDFQSWSDFEIYDEAIQAGLRAEELIPIKEPDWYTHPANEMGQAACFQRLDDSTIWIVLLPERASGGYWKKLTA